MSKGFSSTLYMIVGALVALGLFVILFFLLKGDILRTAGLSVGKLVEF